MKWILKSSGFVYGSETMVIKVQELLLQHLQLFTSPHEEATDTKRNVKTIKMTKW
jgi:hypothetical protein